MKNLQFNQNKLINAKKKLLREWITKNKKKKLNNKLIVELLLVCFFLVGGAAVSAPPLKTWFLISLKNILEIFVFLILQFFT